MHRYCDEIEKQMQKFYNSLNEKDKRRYAAVEALKLGFGGKKYICELLGCDLKTVNKGINDLKDEALLKMKRIRKKGGGRKSILQKKDEICGLFLKVIKNNTAGSPMDEKIRWTNLSRPQIAAHLSEKGYKVSVPVVNQLLKKHNFRKRKALNLNWTNKLITMRNNLFLLKTKGFKYYFLVFGQFA